jgi:4-hydroxyproline epimerase
MNDQVTWPDAIDVMDSHTEGEPTRVVIDGWPALRGKTMAERRDDLLARHDRLRQAVVCEPRGHDALVGALLTPATNPGSAAGVVFFNNVGALAMCGHGLIGVVRTLHRLGRLSVGAVRVDTPVGSVGAELHDDHSVTLENVPAFCHALDVEIDVPGVGLVGGDVAWGGNWFFLTQVSELPLGLEGVPGLIELCTRILRVLQSRGITGRNGAAIDHIELLGPARRPDADARSFVLCPGLAWDRSPCGTGTSAKMATLAARGQLPPGRRWRQESLTGGLFEGWLEERDRDLVPHVRGRAFITGRTTLVFEANDPLREGVTTAAP